MQSIFQEKYNNCVISALLYNHLPISEKERKLQQFMNDPERYDIFCDNIYSLVINKVKNDEIDTLYLTTEGFSFICNSSMPPQPSCFPVLTVKSECIRRCVDISCFIEIALLNFEVFCDSFRF